MTSLVDPEFVDIFLEEVIELMSDWEKECLRETFGDNLLQNSLSILTRKCCHRKRVQIFYQYRV